MVPKAADDYIATQHLDNNKNASLQDLTSRLKGIGVQNLDDLKFLSQDAIRFMTDTDLDDEVLKRFLGALKVREAKPHNVDDGLRILGQGPNSMEKLKSGFLIGSRRSRGGVSGPSPIWPKLGVVTLGTPKTH